MDTELYLSNVKGADFLHRRRQSYFMHTVMYDILIFNRFYQIKVMKAISLMFSHLSL